MHRFTHFIHRDEAILVLVYSLKLFGKLCFFSFVALEANKEANNAALEQGGALEVHEVFPYHNDFILLDLAFSQLCTDPGMLQQILRRSTTLRILV